MAFIKLLRPHQYIKNLLVFFPLFFALKINNAALLKQSLIAFAAFCFAASTIYIVNDIRDIEKDRAHPEKKNRPLASGKVSVKSAIIISVILFLAAVSCVIFWRNETFLSLSDFIF
jgi:decaprenyl-phosphate phosphoribosyltransferase